MLVVRLDEVAGADQASATPLQYLDSLELALALWKVTDADGRAWDDDALAVLDRGQLALRMAHDG